MEHLAFALSYAIPAFGAAIGCGLIGYAALNAFGRNPEKGAEIRTIMILAISFVDALGIIGFIAGFIAKQ